MVPDGRPTAEAVAPHATVATGSTSC